MLLFVISFDLNNEILCMGDNQIQVINQLCKIITKYSVNFNELDTEAHIAQVVLLLCVSQLCQHFVFNHMTVQLVRERPIGGSSLLQPLHL